jgi:hypothetical protein
MVGGDIIGDAQTNQISRNLGQFRFNTAPIVMVS